MALVTHIDIFTHVFNPFRWQFTNKRTLPRAVLFGKIHRLEFTTLFSNTVR